MLPSHTASISQGEPSPPLSNSFHSEEDLSLHDSAHDYSPHEDDDEWADESDLASLSNGIAPVRAHSDPHLRSHSRPLAHAHAHPHAPPPRHPPPPRQTSYHRQVRRPPVHSPSVDPNDEYSPYGQPHQGHFPPFGRGQQPGYQQGHGGGFPFPGGQMTHHGGFANPFTPISSNSSASGYMGHDPRAPYGELMQYPPGYYPVPPPHAGGLPAYFQQLHLGQHGMPYDPSGQSLVPSPSDKAQSEAERKLRDIERERERKESDERNRQQAEEQFKARMEELRKVQEANQLELERARAEAARVTREKIEAERKAEEERVKQHAEAMKQAEERARIKFEAEMKAAEARRKKEEEERAKAEEAAKIRVQAAIRAEAEARIAAEKKAAEEAEKLKQIHAEAKRKAEAEAQAKLDAEKEAAARKAEDEAATKKEKEAWKKKIEEETRMNLEELAKKDRGPFIQFKDALGRKFSFPFHYARVWTNMEELIRQAFDNVDDLAVQVQEGWFDLIGPAGEIILPSVWEKTLEPDWSVTMAMWPLERIRNHPRAGMAAMAGLHGMGGIHGMASGRHQMPPVPPPVGGHRRGAGGIPAGVVPPPGWNPGPSDPRRGGIPAGIRPVPDPGKGGPSSKSRRNSAFLGFLAGKPPPKKKGHKK